MGSASVPYPLPDQLVCYTEQHSHIHPALKVSDVGKPFGRNNPPLLFCSPSRSTVDCR